MHQYGRCIYETRQVVPSQKEINLIHSIKTYFFKLRFNRIILSMPTSSKLSLSLRLYKWFPPLPVGDSGIESVMQY
jgi:hypothetical protein